MRTRTSWHSLALIVITMASIQCPGAEPLALGHPDFRPSSSHPIGYRGDWTGRFPAATPPLRWSSEQNLLWKTPMPGASNANPLVLPDRIFVASAPLAILCLNRDGSIRWQHLKHADASVKKLAQHREALVHQRFTLQRQLQLKQRQGAPTDELDQLKTALREAVRKCRGMATGYRQHHWFNYTPICDGQALYCLLPTGLLVTYDLDGTVLWQRFHDLAVKGPYGTLASNPVMADDKLVLHYGSRLFCYSNTGDLLWERDDIITSPKSGKDAQTVGWGSPVTGQVDDVWYLATGTGGIYRLSDGQQVYKGGFSTISSPIFFNKLFCWVTHAVQPPTREQHKAVRVWQCTNEKGLKQFANWAKQSPYLGHNDYPNPVHDAGLLYYDKSRGNGFIILDATTGQVLDSQGRPAMPDGTKLTGDVYAGIIMAGSYLFDVPEDGGTIIYRKGPTVNMVGTNVIKDYIGGSAPVFSGSQMFLQGRKFLYCIEEQQ